jgi:hypothetical protein
VSSINRSAFIITIKETYKEWARSLDDDEPDEIESEGNIYLVPEIDLVAEKQVRDHLKRFWKSIAEEEFFSWCTDPEQWPELKTIRDFEKFFAWEFREILYDLVEEPILSEDDEYPVDTRDYSTN